MKEKKKKLTYLEKLEILLGRKMDEAYLLYYGKFVFRKTVESAAKSYFETEMTNVKLRKKAEALGLI